MNNETPKLKENEKKDEQIINDAKEKVENVVEESKEILIKESKSYKQFFKDAKEYLSTKNTKDLGEMLVRLLIIVAIIVVLNFPFMLFKDIFPEILMSVNANYTSDAINKFNAVVNIIYSILGIVLFFAICKNRFYKMVKEQEIIKNSK